MDDELEPQGPAVVEVVDSPNRSGVWAHRGRHGWLHLAEAAAKVADLVYGDPIVIDTHQDS